MIDRIKTVCGFVLLFTGASYMAMWVLLFGAKTLLGVAMHSDFLSPSMHAAGVTAATLTTARLLVYLRNRPRSQAMQAAPIPQAVDPLILRPSLQRRLQPVSKPLAPRAEFGLRRLHR